MVFNIDCVPSERAIEEARRKHQGKMKLSWLVILFVLFLFQFSTLYVAIRDPEIIHGLFSYAEHSHGFGVFGAAIITCAWCVLEFLAVRRFFSLGCLEAWEADFLVLLFLLSVVLVFAVVGISVFSLLLICLFGFAGFYSGAALSKVNGVKVFDNAEKINSLISKSKRASKYLKGIGRSVTVFEYEGLKQACEDEMLDSENLKLNSFLCK